MGNKMKIAEALIEIEYNNAIKAATLLAVEITEFCSGNTAYIFEDDSVLDDDDGKVTFYQN